MAPTEPSKCMLTISEVDIGDRYNPLLRVRSGDSMVDTLTEQQPMQSTMSRTHAGLTTVNGPLE